MMARLRTLGPRIRSASGSRIATIQRDAGQHRRSARARGYDSRWDRESRGYRELHPWCRPCEQQGRKTLATQVDHIIPHEGDERLFWNMDNWQPICRRCHEAKSAREAEHRNKHPRGE